MKNLYIVSTPIGNLQDITLRAIETLKNVDSVVCEDKRVATKLLNHYGIHKPLRVLNAYNENETYLEVLELLKDHSVALISDAGTPLISDPGYKLVAEARKKGILVVTIPGPSSPLAALSISGLPTDKFLFLGYLPRKQSHAKKLLHDVTLVQHSIAVTVVLFSAPHKLVNTLELMRQTLGDIEIVIEKELTKMYETVLSGTISELLSNDVVKNPKGEFIILFNLKRET